MAGRVPQFACRSPHHEAEDSQHERSKYQRSLKQNVDSHYAIPTLPCQVFFTARPRMGRSRLRAGRSSTREGLYGAGGCAYRAFLHEL